MRKNRKGFNYHHRKSKALGGKGDSENLSHVPQSKHAAWHTLFSGELTVKQIAHIINSTWLDPDWELVPQRRPK